MKKLLILGLVIYISILFFSRFYNVEYTARFTEDESGFLVRLHQIYVERKITLVGHVNEQGTKVFGSLSVYLLLPFAVLAKFDPASIFMGAAFWGVFTVLVMLYLSKLVNRRLMVLSSLLLLLWYPLVQTGRWAWNPNFIPFWISLGIICYYQKKILFAFLCGVYLGLSVHHHYYAIFATSTFIFIINILTLFSKQFKKALLIDLGFILTLLPFIIFDLRHPPGIFILGAYSQTQHIAPIQILNRALDFTSQIMQYYTQSTLLAVILTVSILLLATQDIFKRNKAILFLVPCVLQIIVIAALANYSIQYFFAIIPFLLVWLIYPREKIGQVLPFIAITSLVIGGAISLQTLLTIPSEDTSPDLQTVKKITNIIKREIESKNLKKVNIATLSSPDHNTQARKYKDLLLVPDNIQVMSKYEYFSNDLLFVVSTAPLEKLRKDPAGELNNFRSGTLLNKSHVDNSLWVVYLLGRNGN